MKSTDVVLKNVDHLKKSIIIDEDPLAPACEIIKNIFDDTKTIGIDIDGTIDENPEFFSVLTKIWPGAIVVITYRDDREKAEKLLSKFDVYYDKLVLSNSLDKSKLILENKIDVYVDDQDECLINIPESVTVLKIRNEGNSEKGKWLYSTNTGIDQSKKK